MPDYQQGRIYVIRAPNTPEVYVGSTCVPLSKRMAQHRNAYKHYLAGKSGFITSFKMIEREGAYIELLQDFPCTTKEQLNKREGEHIRAEEHSVNKVVAGRTRKEYKMDNSSSIKEYDKAYSRAYREAKKLIAQEQQTELDTASVVPSESQ